MNQHPTHYYYSYVALSAHFGGTYDYFKYQGKSRATLHSYKKCKYKHYFPKFANRLGPDDFVSYCVSNLKKGKKWIGDFTDNNYLEHQRYQQSFAYHYKSELQNLLGRVDEFEGLFKCDGNNHPIIIKEYAGSRVCLDTLVILEQILRYRKNFDRQIKEEFMWPNISKLMCRYEPFMKIDVDKARQYTLQIVEDES